MQCAMCSALRMVHGGGTVEGASSSSAKTTGTGCYAAEDLTPKNANATLFTHHVVNYATALLAILEWDADMSHNTFNAPREPFDWSVQLCTMGNHCWSCNDEVGHDRVGCTCGTVNRRGA